MKINHRKRLFFISTNEVWGGSESLWYYTALEFLKQGFHVSVAVNYYNEKTDALKQGATDFVDFITTP